MNEEVKYCNQCGAKISSDSKFCSGCGHDLKNSSTQITLDKTIKVEVTNATVEKGFKAIESGVKGIGSTIEEGAKATGSTLEEGAKATNRRLLFYLLSCGKIIERIIIISIIGAIFYGVAFILF